MTLSDTRKTVVRKMRKLVIIYWYNIIQNETKKNKKKSKMNQPNGYCVLFATNPRTLPIQTNKNTHTYNWELLSHLRILQIGVGVGIENGGKSQIDADESGASHPVAVSAGQDECSRRYRHTNAGQL